MFLSRPIIDADDRAFIERMDMFFLATANGDGAPQCSYKGLLAAVARGEVAGAERRAQDLSDRCEGLVALFVPVEIVDVLEVIEVEEHGSERTEATGRLRRHPLQRLIRGATVGQTGQGVAGSACFREREVALVGQDRSGRRDRVADAAALALPHRVPPGDQYRTDYLPTDQQEFAGDIPCDLPAYLTLDQRVFSGPPLVAAAEEHRHARARLELLERDPAQSGLIEVVADRWLERWVARLTGAASIRETTLFPSRPPSAHPVNLS